jgi:hypothetical protein
MPFRVSAITGILIFVTTLVATGSFYSDTFDGILASGTVLAAMLFIPYFAAATLLQVLIGRISRNLHVSSKNETVVWPLVWIGIVFVGALVTFNAINENHKKTFEVFFSEKPPNGSLVNYSYSRTIFAGGTYLLILKMQSNEAKTFLTQQGYSLADYNSNPGVITYNGVLSRMADSSYFIDDSFVCYVKDTDISRLRIYIDLEKKLLLCIGFVPKSRGGGPTLNTMRQP